MLGQVVQLVLRHALTAGGTYLVAAGVTDEATAQALVGALLTVGGIVWSIAEKRIRGAL